MLISYLIASGISRLHRYDPHPEPFAGRAARFIVIAAGIGAEPFGARAAANIVRLHIVLRRIAVSIDLRAGTVELAIAAEQHFGRLLHRAFIVKLKFLEERFHGAIIALLASRLSSDFCAFNKINDLQAGLTTGRVSAQHRLS